MVLRLRGALSRSICTCPVYISPKAPPLKQSQENAILSFPWFNPEQLKQYYKPEELPTIPEKGKWTDFVSKSNVTLAPGILKFAKKFLVNRESIEDFNILYREFHQWVALPDYEGLDHLCDKRLAKHLKKVIKNIHIAGLALDLERLTVRQPKMEILDFKIYKGLYVDRDKNGNMSDYIVGKGSVYGLWPKCIVYKRRNQTLNDDMEIIEETHKPYLIHVKVLIHSHMRLFGYTKNEFQLTSVNTELGDDMTPNIVQFEINVKGIEFYKILPTEGKAPLTRQWKMTDFNNALEGNPLLSL